MSNWTDFFIGCAMAGSVIGILYLMVLYNDYLEEQDHIRRFGNKEVET